MIPPELTARERIIYTTLPDGMTNSIAIKNAALDRGSTTLHEALRALLNEGSLAESHYTYRDPTFNRPRNLGFYRLTTKGMTTYFPAIAAHSPAIQAWMRLYPDLSQLPFIPPSNASRRERALRVLETETFCSAAGILTLLEPRSAHSPAVFGCLDYPSVPVSLPEPQSCEAPSRDDTVFSFQNRLCEAVKLSREDPVWNRILSDALCPNDPYSFYRTREITTLAKSNGNENEKDLAVIRSQYVGIIANRKRGFVVYRAPRYNGMSWLSKMEMKVTMGVSHFCSRSIPNSSINTLYPVEDAIFFYQTNKELLALFTKTAQEKLPEFGNPFRHLYAIPFSAEGLLVLRALLSSPTYERDCLDAVCENDPSFARTKGASLYQLNYFDTIPCLSAFPVEIRRTARVFASLQDGDCGIVGYPWQKTFFAKLLPDAVFFGMKIAE